MNRSKAAKKPFPAPAKQSPRKPLRAISTTSNHGSEASSSSSSSSISIEAPRGCLRFFLSHSSSSNLKTPKSAPVLRRPSGPKENRVSKNPQKSKHKTSSSCLSRNAQKFKAKGTSFESASHLGHSNELKSDGTLTPLLCKIPTGLDLGCKLDKTEDVSNKSDSTTPPVQASVSPEIQFGSSAVSSASLACYAAGHVLSGIADKRKCRPRGILNVGENDSGFAKGKALCSFDEVDEDDDLGTAQPDASMVPLPTEASMHWLLSPCNEEDEDHNDHSQTPGVSPNHVHETSSCRSRRNTCISPSGITKFQELLEPLHEHVPVLSSPDCTPSGEVLPLKDERQCIYDFDAEDSPFSMASLSSGNFILTPQSDSSADGHAGLSWSNTDNRYNSELSSVAEAIRMASLSPNCQVLIKDQIDSSFQFDCLTTTCNSISRIQKMLDDQDSWHSNSTLENMSQSQLRISWREGLMSRMYDIDEYDCCRCLSDEEEDIKGCSNDLPKESCQNPEITNNDAGDQILTDADIPILDDEPRVTGKVKEDFPQSCAESISTDGGGLLASRDSDWNLCYKNELFHV